MRKISALLLLIASISAAAQLLPASIGSDALVIVGSNGNTVSLRPGTIPTSFSLTLPVDAGANGDVLVTNGTGTLSWTNPAATGNPSGTIIAFAGATCPAGYLEADGSWQAISSYANLDTALGGSSSPWGGYDGSGNFRLPDLRNRYLRGTGTNGDGQGGTAVALGAYQGDDNKQHNHTIKMPNATYGNVIAQSAWGVAGTTNSTIINVTGMIADSGGAEARPKTYGVLHCIKY